MDYLMISNLLVAGAFFIISCPSECRGLSLGYWAGDYNTDDNQPWRVIRLKRMDDHREYTIDHDKITTGIQRGVKLDPPIVRNPNVGIEIITNRNHTYPEDKNDEENKEVSQQLCADRRASRALSPEPISSVPSIDSCKKYRGYFRKICEASKLREAQEDMEEESSNTADLNSNPTILLLTPKN